MTAPCGSWQITGAPHISHSGYELRIAPIQPADADGWRRWYGGENPAPGKRVDWEFGLLVGSEKSEHAPWKIITHWRESAEQPKPLPPQEPGFGPWIRWEGGENPVGEQIVKVLIRCGREESQDKGSWWNWRHGNGCAERNQIIAYCVKLPERVEEAGFTVGDLVWVYDRYRFAIRLPASVVRHSDTNDGVEVRLLKSNNHNYPVGSLVWVSTKQLRIRESDE